MSTATYVPVDLPEGKRLAQLTGIHNDLRECRDYCELYFKLRKMGLDTLILHQLSESVVSTIFVRYGRCFNEGVRSKTQKELEATIAADYLDTHRLALDCRNKHFAHSVNAFEHHSIIVSLVTDAPERAVTSVSVGSHYVTSLDDFVFENLIRGIDKLCEWLLGEEKKSANDSSL